MKNKTTLHLILKRQWFDLIANGEKKEEYREIKQYWWRQFCRRPTARDFVKSDIIPNKYKFITFHNGYTNDKLTFTCEGISIGKGKKE